MTKSDNSKTKTLENSPHSASGLAYLNGAMFAGSSSVSALPLDGDPPSVAEAGSEVHRGTNDQLLVGMGVLLSRWGGYWPWNGSEENADDFDLKTFFSLEEGEFPTDGNGTNGNFSIATSQPLRSDYGIQSRQFEPGGNLGFAGGSQDSWYGFVDFEKTLGGDFYGASFIDEAGAAFWPLNFDTFRWQLAPAGDAFREKQSVQSITDIADADVGVTEAQYSGETTVSTSLSAAALPESESGTALAREQSSIDGHVPLGEDNIQQSSDVESAEDVNFGDLSLAAVVHSDEESAPTQADAAVALRDLASGLYTVKGAASLANKPLTVVKHFLKSVDTLEKNRDQLESGATKLQKIAKVFQKLGPTKVAGKIAETVAKNTKKKLDAIEVKLEEIDAATDKVAVVVEKVSKALSLISKGSEALGIAADVYSRKLAVADQNLASANQLFDTGIPFFGGNPNMEESLKLQVAIAYDKNASAAAEIAIASGFVQDMVANIDGLTVLTSWDGFTPLQRAAEALQKIADALSPIFDPLSAVYDAVGPVPTIFSIP